MLIARSIVRAVEHSLKIDCSGSVWRPERNGDGRQPVTKPDGPEVRGPSLLGPADHHGIIAFRHPFLGHGIPSSQQVQFYQMGRTAKQFSTLGKILIAIVASPLVGRIQQLDHGHELASLPVSDFQ
jgi:hypothetical protein